MNNKFKLENVLFLDIETVPQHENFSDISEELQEFIQKKLNTNAKMNSHQKSFTNAQAYGLSLGKLSVFLLALLSPTKENYNLEQLPFMVMKKNYYLSLKHYLKRITENRIIYYAPTTAKNLIFLT